MGKFHTYTYFKSHIDIDEKYVGLIKKAYIQINDNMECVTNYFDIKGQKKRRDGVSLTKKLSGKKKIEYKVKNTDKYFARTIFDNVTFATRYLQAAYNSYHEEVDTDMKESYLAEFAATIIHEAAHAALGNEKYAYLIDHYYRYEMGRKKGWTGNAYVASEKPKSWLPQDYKNEKDVKTEVDYLKPKFQELELPEGLMLPPGINYGKYYLV